jgi:hypothetical protein
VSWRLDTIVQLQARAGPLLDRLCMQLSSGQRVVLDGLRVLQLARLLRDLLPPRRAP